MRIEKKKNNDNIKFDYDEFYQQENQNSISNLETKETSKQSKKGKKILLILLIFLIIGFFLVNLNKPNDDSNNSNNINQSISLEFSDEVIELNINQIHTIKYKFLNTDTPIPITWKSSNESIVTIQNDGKIKALKEGNVTITAYYTINNVPYSKTCLIKVSKDNNTDNKQENNNTQSNQDNNNQSNQNNNNNQNNTQSSQDNNNNQSNQDNNNNQNNTHNNQDNSNTQNNQDSNIQSNLENKIYYLNTGTSDAIILQSNNEFGMIDTGDSASREYVINFMKELKIKKLNFILITHFHSDHYCGLDPILKQFEVSKLYIKEYKGIDSQTSKGTSATDQEIKEYRNSNKKLYNYYKTLATTQGTKVLEINSKNQNNAINQGTSLGEFKLSFYNRSDRLSSFIQEDGTDWCLLSKNCNENINTIVVYGEINGKKLYFSGDIENQTIYTDSTHKVVYQEKKVENEIALSVKNTKLKTKNDKIDIYKASHHGFINNNTGTAINYLKPQNVIITNKLNKYTQYKNGDYPRKDTTPTNQTYLENLVNYVGEKNVYVTGNGTVIANIDKIGNISFTQIK